MANTQLETLTITLNAEVGNAKRNLKSVATSIENLEKVGKNADWKVFATIKRNLEGIAKIDFSNVANSLKDVVSAMRALGLKNKELGVTSKTDMPIMGTNVPTAQVEPDFNLPKLEEFGFTLDNLREKFIVFDDATRSVKELNDPLSQIRNRLAEVNLSAQQISVVMKDLGLSTETLAEQKLRVLKETLQSIGFYGKDLEAELDRLGISALEAGKKAEKATPKWKKMLNQIKRIAFYRMVRRAIQMIVQAIKEGIQNMALYDSEFNASMSQIMSSIKYLKNSLGAMVAPLIEYLAPLLTYVSQILGDVANKIGEVFSAMQGKDVFKKAKMSAEDYAESLKKAKNASIGIDELNVLQQEDTQDYFEEATVGEDVLGIGENIGGILDTVINVVKELFDLIGAITQLIMPIIEPILKFVNYLLKAVDGALGTIINLLKETFAWLQPIVDIISYIVDGILVNAVLAIETVLGVFRTFAEFAVAVGKTIRAIFTGNAKEIGNIWGELGEKLKKIWANVINFFIKLINWLIGAFENFLNFFVDIGAEIASWFGADTSEWGVKFNRIQEISYATGGFPEDGMFFANHNELVGQFSNGKTAVANNEEITEGIYRAVLEAMNDSSSGGNGGNIVIQLDGREIAKSVEKYDNLKGKNIVSGGAKYGY